MWDLCVHDVTAWFKRKYGGDRATSGGGPINFWVRGSSHTLIDYTIEDGSLVCPVKVRWFFFILIMCFVFNIIDQLHNYITVFAVTVYLFECPFKMKYSILNRLIYIWWTLTYIIHYFFYSWRRDSHKTYIILNIRKVLVSKEVSVANPWYEKNHRIQKFKNFIYKILLA